MNDFPNPSLHYVVGFSGGKDSVAAWLHLTRELQLPHVTCLYADTGHEFPELADYLTLLERDHGLPLVRITPTLRDMEGELSEELMRERLGIPDVDGWRDTPLTMESLAILKRRFPSATVRFCTTLLKLSPSRRWTDVHFPDRSAVVRVSGVRAQESRSRAMLSPITHDDFMGCLYWLPIHTWTHEQVFECHRRHGVPPNPLYLQGMGRVGCAPCIMAKKCELRAIAERRPDTFDRLDAMERRVSAAVADHVDRITFFSTGKTSRAYASHSCSKTGKPLNDAYAVRDWALSAPDESEIDLFEDQTFDDDRADATVCQSRYGLCE